MQVGVNELVVFAAGGAGPATVVRLSVLAVDVLGIRNSQCQASAPFGTKEKLRMAYPVFAYRIEKVLLYVFLSDNFFK